MNAAGRPHQLFFNPDKEELTHDQINRIAINRKVDGHWKRIPRDFAPDDLPDLNAVHAEFGGGTYQFIALDHAHRHKQFSMEFSIEGPPKYPGQPTTTTTPQNTQYSPTTPQIIVQTPPTDWTKILTAAFPYVSLLFGLMKPNASAKPPDIESIRALVTLSKELNPNAPQQDPFLPQIMAFLAQQNTTPTPAPAPTPTRAAPPQNTRKPTPPAPPCPPGCFLAWDGSRWTAHRYDQQPPNQSAAPQNPPTPTDTTQNAQAQPPQPSESHNQPPIGTDNAQPTAPIAASLDETTLAQAMETAKTREGQLMIKAAIPNDFERFLETYELPDLTKEET